MQLKDIIKLNTIKLKFFYAKEIPKMTKLPYITAPGNIEKALSGIKIAPVPPKVSQDFVKNILKIPGGSGDQMTSFLKKLGMTNADSSPNEDYKKFRNPSHSRSILAKLIRNAYAQIFAHNEYANTLSDSELTDLVAEITGEAHGASSVKLASTCFRNLRDLADFDSEVPVVVDNLFEPQETSENTRSPSIDKDPIALNLGYTINLNLPAVSDPAVFDAIFKSLKSNLLSEEDA
ncbi:MAG: DUF5343 domain-containing protein [Hyphomicrobiales bacterium]